MAHITLLGTITISALYMVNPSSLVPMLVFLPFVQQITLQRTSYSGFLIKSTMTADAILLGRILFPTNNLVAASAIVIGADLRLEIIFAACYAPKDCPCGVPA